MSINLYLPYITKLIIDGLTEKTLVKNNLYFYLSLYAVLGTICVIFSRTLRQIPLKLSHKIEYKLRDDIFSHLTKLDRSFYKSMRTGDLMTRLSSDINLVRDAIGQGILQGVRTIVVLVFSLIVMLLTDVELALTVYILYIPMVIIFIILRVMRKNKKSYKNMFLTYQVFQESFSGIRCIKGFAIEKRRNGEFEEVNNGLIKKNMIVQATRQSLWPFMSFWFGLGMILILNLGGKRVINGDLSLGTITQFIQYLLYMQWPLLALSWTSSLYQRGVVSWTRVREIMLAKSKITDFSNDNKNIINNCKINFKNISLTLDNTELLKNINFEIEDGTCLGITGPTGSGKSLLISLMTRINDPTSGVIYIDDINIKKLSLHNLRELIGHAAQEPVLFQILFHTISDLERITHQLRE